MRLVAGHLLFFVLLAATLCGSAQAMDYAHPPRLRHPIPGRTLRRPVLGDAQAALDAVNAEDRNDTACALVASPIYRAPRRHGAKR